MTGILWIRVWCDRTAPLSVFKYYQEFVLVWGTLQHCLGCTFTHLLMCFVSCCLVRKDCLYVLGLGDTWALFQWYIHTNNLLEHFAFGRQIKRSLVSGLHDDLAVSVLRSYKQILETFLRPYHQEMASTSFEWCFSILSVAHSHQRRVQILWPLISNKKIVCFGWWKRLTQSLH